MKTSILVSLLIWAGCLFGQGLMSPAGVSRPPAGGGPAVFTSDKYIIRDNQGGALTWDLQGEIGNPAATTVSVYLRDNAGAKVIEFERTFIGSPSNIARLDMSLEPKTSGARYLGSSTRHWLATYTLATYTQGLHSTGGSSHINLNDHLIPAGAGAQDIADSSHRVRKIWTVDLDCSGVCGTTSYWNRTGTTVKPATISDDVLVRKLQLEDNSGAATGLLMDVQAYVGSVAQTRAMIFRDNAGAEMLRLERLLVGTATNRAIFDVSIEPLTDGVRLIGTASKRFGEGHINHVMANFITPPTGALQIDGNVFPSTGKYLGDSGLPWLHVYASTGHFTDLVPISGAGGIVSLFGTLWPDSAGRAIGGTDPIRRWDGYFRDVTIYGTCTGCGGGLLTDGGVTTYLTATGDNFAIGGTSTAYKFDVFGSARVQSNLDVDGSAAISSVLTVYGFGVQRFRVSSSITEFFNGAATLQASVNHNNGSIWGSNGFFTGPGVTQFVDSSKRWVGGLECSTDGGCVLGGFAFNNRFSDASFTGSIYTYDGPGSSNIRFRAGTIGIVVRSSAGAGLFSVSGISGNTSTAGSVNATGGFQTGAFTGWNGTTAAGCTVRGGLIVGAC